MLAWIENAKLTHPYNAIEKGAYFSVYIECGRGATPKSRARIQTATKSWWALTEQMQHSNYCCVWKG